MGRLTRAVEREGEGTQAGGRGEDWEGNPGRVGEVGHQLPHLLQGVGLHQDVVLRQQQRRDLAQLPD